MRGIRPSTTRSTSALYAKSLLNEEPELRERFGEQFEAYCRRLPRWLPVGRSS